MNLVPDKVIRAKGLLNLGFVYGDPLARSHVLIHDEEVESTSSVDLCLRSENDHLAVLLPLDFLSYQGDRLLVFGVCLVDQRLREGLLTGSDHLVQLEFDLSNEVVILQIVNVCLIIDIIHLDLELLLLLEVILSHDLLNKVRVQIVMDHLGTVEFLPHLANALIHYGERVRLRHSVHIDKALARNAELHLLFESTSADISRLEDCIVDVATCAHFAPTDSLAVQVSIS